MSKLMQCGHVAQGTDGNGNAVCVICFGIDAGAVLEAEKPSLEGRFAKCAYFKNNQGRYLRPGGHEPVPSDYGLAFFEYLGPDSEYAKTYCGKCGMHLKAHTEEAMARNRSLKCDTFEPIGPAEFDRYYCGCLGWD